MNNFDWTFASTRNLLHLITVIVWVGGQIMAGALVPAVRKLGPEAPQKFAQQFGRVAWPAFFLAIITGLWNFGENWSDSTDSWKVVLFVKIGIVAVSGFTAWRHQKVEKRSQRALFAMATLFLSLGAVALGIGLGN